MLLSYYPMRLIDAERIVTWKYDHEYEMYSFSDSDEDIHELMNGEYFSVLDERERLVGFICCGDQLVCREEPQSDCIKKKDIWI
ncbi:hypothetical protein [Paenibacillus sp. 1A_MP2]|uniref:hypothetical protein n=1 Tax=Paenibacillus sp. 1A_MP2 TaxID=3457495 RepID=UPI003FCE4DEE